MTSVSASAGGYVSFFPCAAGRPEASSLNYAPSQVVGNSVIVGTGGGVLCAYVSARTHLVLDIVGVFVAPLAPLEPDAGVPSGADAAAGGRTDAGVRDGTDAGASRPGGGGGCGCVVSSLRDAHEANPASWAFVALVVLGLARRRRARSAQRLSPYFATSLPR